MTKLITRNEKTTHYEDLGKTSHLSPLVAGNEAVEAERSWIRKRREAFLGAEVDRPLTGLAFSGGGVRSATFNLGILQAMEECDVLKDVDYLSTVSGGGYIGASLSWFMSQEKDFSFKTSRRKKDVESGEMLRTSAEKRIDWLRRHGEYLTPGRGLDKWALAAAVLRGLTINLLVFIPLSYLIVKALAQELPSGVQNLGESAITWISSANTASDRLAQLADLYNKAFSLTKSTAPQAAAESSAAADSVLATAVQPVVEAPNWFLVVLVLGVMALLFLIVSFIITALLSSVDFQRGFRLRGTATKVSGYLLRFGIAAIALGVVPLVADFVHRNFVQWEQMALGPVTLSGVGSLLLGWKGRAKDAESKGKWGGFVTFGLMLLLYSLLLLLYHFASHRTGGPLGMTVTEMLSVWLPLFLLVLVANVNHLSMHRYYRDRLMQAFMPSFTPRDSETKPLDPNRFRLQDIGRLHTHPERPRTSAPYHIINANLVTLDSDDPRLRARGGDNFIFSPLFCGSARTGYARTTTYLGGTMDLATAFSISGAAVQANTGATRSRPLAILMSLLNVRLGYWIANPNRSWWWKGGLGSAYWFSYFYVLLEMLGLGLDERRRYVHLSDGGHFENLGLYELIRRRCKYIIVCDATADPDFTYRDLARVSQLVRVDFGAEIEIDTRPLMPQEASSTDKDLVYSQQPCVVGEVTYRNGKKGKILYVDTCMFEGLPEDIYGYQRHNRSFPDEPTTDQFFNERQFEAYRELGFRTGKWIFGKPDYRELVSDDAQWRTFCQECKIVPDPTDGPAEHLAGAELRKMLYSRLSPPQIKEIENLKDTELRTIWQITEDLKDKRAAAEMKELTISELTHLWRLRQISKHRLRSFELICEHVQRRTEQRRIAKERPAERTRS